MQPLLHPYRYLNLDCFKTQNVSSNGMCRNTFYTLEVDGDKCYGSRTAGFPYLATSMINHNVSSRPTHESITQNALA